MESQRTTVILKQFLANPKNRDMFGRFAAKYLPRIKKCCLRRGIQEADADDLAATILLRFCERDVFDRFVFTTKEKFHGWLNKVVRNDVSTFLRNRARRQDAWSVGNPEAQEALERVADEMVRDTATLCAEDLARVQKARVRVQDRVEDKTWLVFSLVVDENCKVEKVAQQLGLTRVAVWQAVSRVKRKLREDLTDLHGSNEE